MLIHPDIPMASTTKNMRYVALFSHLLLLIWVAVWQLVITKEHTYSVTFIALFYLVPLLLPLPGILRGKPYTHAWANFFILIYLAHGLTVAYAVPAERWYAVIELALASAMFTGCCFFARLRGKECGLGLGKLKDAMEQEKQHFEGRNA